MRTLTFFERGLASGRTSLRALFDGTTPTTDAERMGVREVVRHLADPSLAVAALAATPERLLSSEIGWTGLLFESQVAHDLRVLAQPLRADVRFYRDNKGLEVDAIVEHRDGRWLAVECKLGAGRIDEGATHLLALRDKLDPATAARCVGLVVVAADTPTYLRPDGVLVTSLASLGP
jgi:uncharacterized protein